MSLVSLYIRNNSFFHDAGLPNSQLSTGTSVLADRSFSEAVCLWFLPFHGCSVAATCPDHHVAVLLQDHVGAVIKVEDRDAVKLRG